MGTKSKHGTQEESKRRNAEAENSWMERIQDLEKMAEQYAQIRDKESIPEHVLNVGIGLYIEMRAQTEGEDTEPWKGFDEYLGVVEEVQEHMREKLQNPAKRRALELVLEADEFFWMKQYEDSMKKIIEAADLDPEYVYKVEGLRKAIGMELRKGPVRLTYAINRILYPRLRNLGFHPKIGEDSTTWNEQTSHLIRINSRGLEGGMDMGRTKFGKRFALAVWRQSSSGEDERLDLGTVGLDDDVLCYLNQEEANAMLERIANEFEGPILAWLDEER